jgi:Ser/Thr protein kinase RdoA (MazF antagonist)
LNDGQPPRAIVECAGIEPADVSLLPWRVPIWRVVYDGVVAVLRRSRIDALFSVDDLRWQHRVQLLLSDRGLCVPVPIRVFDGETAFAHDGWAWEVLTYLRGRPLGWEAQPTLREVGALMARFHTASADLPVADQRPNVVPLSALAARVDLAVIDASLPDERSRSAFRRHLADIEDRLGGFGEAAAPRGLVHGDLTTLNVLVDGSPPTVSGLIDFSNAYLEQPLADIGFSLWQAGRPAHHDYTLDLTRVRDLVAGYVGQRQLPLNTAPQIATYIEARGVQRMVRSSLRGPNDLLLPLNLVAWIADQRAPITASVSEAISGSVS